MVRKERSPLRRTLVFLIALLLFLLCLDAAARAVMQPFFIRCGRFWLDDYELTRRSHPEEVWDKVFFGSSTVIAGYREEESESGYVNLGIDDGVVEDLWDMIRGGHIRVGSELVIGVNELTLYDDFPTNPNYIWNRKFYEPYCYFARTRFSTLIRETARQALGLGGPDYRYLSQEKTYYWGVMSQSEIDAKLESGNYAQYLHLSSADFDRNFAALEQICRWSEREGVRVRIVFMPANPAAGASGSRDAAFARLSAFCAQQGLELLDLRDAYDAECFYDIGHLNREYGSHRFTKELDPWLNS